MPQGNKTMTYPPLPDAASVAEHFSSALQGALRVEEPYRHWKLANVLPEDMCTGILTLPIAPSMLGETDGTRNTYNTTRTFLTPSLRARYPACAILADALQRPEIARQLEETLQIEAEGSFLRIEYIQDLNGAWLEPHRDIPEKLFSMVIYLCTGPDAKDWGTDIYDAQCRWVGRSSADFNSAVVFIAGPATWHGFERRPINGVRRLMEINYVRDWRDREQLTFPDQPIAVAGQTTSSS